jgi:hypothetical protein
VHLDQHLSGAIAQTHGHDHRFVIRTLGIVPPSRSRVQQREMIEHHADVVLQVQLAIGLEAGRVVTDRGAMVATNAGDDAEVL